MTDLEYYIRDYKIQKHQRDMAIKNYKDSDKKQRLSLIEKFAILKPDDIIDIQYPNLAIPIERLLIHTVEFEYSTASDDFDITYRYQRANKDGKFTIRCKFGILSHSTLIKSTYEHLDIQ